MSLAEAGGKEEDHAGGEEGQEASPFSRRSRRHPKNGAEGAERSDSSSTDSAGASPAASPASRRHALRVKESEDRLSIEMDDVVEESDAAASMDDEREESVSEKAEKPKMTYTLRDARSPAWWGRLLWEWKGSIIYFTLVFIALLLLGLLVNGWNDFVWQAWYSISVTVVVFYMLVTVSWMDPAVVMLLSVALLLAPEVITTKEAAEGFGNTQVLTIAFLFVVAAGIERSGCLHIVTRVLLKGSSRVWVAQLRMMVPVALISGFINNIPLVAMMMPAVEDFCRSTDIPASKMMIPLSYSAIFGGTLTIIGTSTNLIVVALVQQHVPEFSIGFFDIAAVGGPIIALGLIYVVIMGRWLLPTRTSPLTDMDRNPSKYLITMIVNKGSRLSGVSIEAAKLRHLRGVFLTEIERDGNVISAPGPEFVLSEGDLLLFAGDVNNVSDLFRVRGLSVIGEEDHMVFGYSRMLLEGVVAGHSSLIGATVADAQFREKFDAAILSIFRSGHPAKGKMGDVVLQPGDTLLMVGRLAHFDVYRSDFVIVTQVGQHATKINFWKAVLAPILVIAMVVLASVEVTTIMTTSICTMFAMVFLQIMTLQDMHNAVNMTVLVTIAASFPLAQALDKWGVAEEMASNLLTITNFAGDYGLIFGVYLSTCLLTALLSNASAAAIMVPIAVNLSGTTDVSLKAFAITVMVAASADLSTPIGYQTNLMVWGPGGYKFLDYTRFGMPLQILLAAMSSGIILGVYAKGGDEYSTGQV